MIGGVLMEDEQATRMSTINKFFLCIGGKGILYKILVRGYPDPKVYLFACHVACQPSITALLSIFSMSVLLTCKQCHKIKHVNL
jgi:hypothetical protein